MKEIIKHIRSQVAMNQEQFAAALGTTAITINRWENGKSLPTKMAQASILRFCEERGIDLFGIVMESIIGQNDEHLLYHGSKTGIVGTIAPISRSMCDFGKGFYMGTNPLQPLTLICDESKPVFYSLQFDMSNLKVLHVDVGIEWAMLIAFNRGYMDEVKGSAIYNRYAAMAKGYDVICGYIANDRMYRVMKDFFEKNITDTALIHSLHALDLGTQYVAMNEKACANIKVVREYKLQPLELETLKRKSIRRREESIALTEGILLQYRREGKYFDEIIRGE